MSIDFGKINTMKALPFRVSDKVWTMICQACLMENPRKITISDLFDAMSEAYQAGLERGKNDALGPQSSIEKEKP